MARLLVGVLCFVHAAGCGDDASRVDVTDGRRRVGDRDRDGSVEPSDASAGSRDGAIVDGEVRNASDAALDGALADGEVPPLGPPHCQTAEETSWQTTVTFSDEGGFDLQPGPTGFGLVHMAELAGVERLNVARIGSTGVIPEPVALFDMRTNSAKVLDSALVYDGADWQVVWTDNSAGQVELMAMTVDEALEPPSSPTVERITDTAVQAVEKRPVTARIRDRAFAAWVVEESRVPVSVWISELGAGGDPVEVVPASSGHQPKRVALSEIGTDPETATGALAWIEPDEPGAQKGVWLQPLDGDGAASGGAIKLSDQVSVGDSVSLASNITGGAAVYSVVVGGSSREVRFVRLDGMGRPSSGEIPIVASPLQGMDAAIAALGQGYVIAYRALPGGVITKPEIRVVFVSKEGVASVNEAGNVISLPLSDAGSASARLTVQVSNEGQVLVGWLDQVSGNKTLRLARRRLDCR